MLKLTEFGGKWDIRIDSYDGVHTTKTTWRLWVFLAQSCNYECNDLFSLDQGTPPPLLGRRAFLTENDLDTSTD